MGGRGHPAGQAGDLGHPARAGWPKPIMTRGCKRPTRRSARSPCRRLLLLALAPLLALLVGAAPAVAAKHKRAQRKPGPPLTTVAIERSFPGPVVPSGFLGLSFEVGSLASWRATPNTGDLVTLLRSLGPGVMRLGGVTADKNVAWVDARDPRARVGHGDDRRRGPARPRGARRPQRLARAADPQLRPFRTGTRGA